MKTKKLFLFAVGLLAWQAAFAQSFTHCTTCDTIPGRYYRYYYSEWYDTCYAYNDTVQHWWSNDFTMYSPVQCNGALYAKLDHTPQPMGIQGITAMVDINAGGHYFRDTLKMPEYLYLYQVGDIDTTVEEGERMRMILLDSARWDTVKPHIMRLPRNGYEEKYSYCYAYDVYFKAPVYVDSSFYLGGSTNSNYCGPTETDPNPIYSHIPTIYRTMVHMPFENVGVPYDENDPMPEPCEPIPYGLHNQGGGSGGPWWYNGIDVFGYFLPIVSQHQLNVESDSIEMGGTGGSGYFPDDWYDTIRAIPALGYRFTRWNDGNTDNPRIVKLHQDTLFTAFFAEGDVFSVQLAVNDPALGSVTGEGYYNAGDAVTLQAIPTDERCSFVWWNDHVTDNPRTFTLTQDTAFTAIFCLGDTTGITAAAVPQVKISPNPVRDNLSVRMGEAGDYRVEVYNDLGRCLLERTFAGERLRLDLSSLATGHYLLKVQSAQGVTVRSFIKR